MKLEETEGMLEQKDKALETQLVSNNDLNSSIQTLKDQLSEKLATSDQLGSKCDQLQKLLDDTTEEIEALKSVSEQIFEPPPPSHTHPIFYHFHSVYIQFPNSLVFVIHCSVLLDDEISRIYFSNQTYAIICVDPRILIFNICQIIIKHYVFFTGVQEQAR